MRKAFLLLSLFVATLSSSFISASEQQTKVGIVNFKACLDESLLGKKEQQYLEELKTKISSSFNEKEKELTDLYNKLNDPEYMDGLSPEAEKELKEKFQMLSEQMSQMQYENSQLATQSQFKVLQSMDESVKSAAQQVANNMGLDMVVNKDTTFFFKESLDVTQEVIQEMNKSFEDTAANATEEETSASS